MLKLVYGCLAFSVVALVIVFVAAADQGHGFRGTTKSMVDAVTQGATVIAADRDGAVTQTGNGGISGFRFGSKDRVWSTKISRFEEGPANPYGAGAIDATASCAGGCPSSIVEVIGEFEAYGGASPQLAKALTTLKQGEEGLLAVTSKNSAFIRAPVSDSPEPQLLWIVDDKVTPAPVANPSAVEVDAAQNNAVSGASDGKNGTLTPLTLDGLKWSSDAAKISEAGLKNACISPDGDWVGSVGKRVHRFAFGSESGDAIGPAVASGTCTVDSAGITVPFTVGTDRTLRVARYSPSGATLWTKQLGAENLLSEGGSPYVIGQALDGTVTVLDGITGSTLLTKNVVGPPYVGADGSVVVADRKGDPTWLIRGRSVN